MAGPSADDHRGGRRRRSFRSPGIWLRWIVVTACLATGGHAAAADGVLTGSVVDDLGRPLAGVSVSVQGPRLGLERRSVTDQTGGFRVAGLAPGGYRASFDRPGYQWLEVRDVDLGPGAELVLSITLNPTAGDEFVLLTGGPSVEGWATVDAVSRNGDALAALPDGGRRLVAMAPGAVPRVDDRWSEPTAAAFGDPVVPPRWTVDGLELVGDAAPPPELPAEATAGWRALRAGAGLEIPAAPSGVHVLALRTPGLEPAGSVELGWSDDDLAGAGRPMPRARAPWIGTDDSRRGGFVLGLSADDGRLGLLATAVTADRRESLRLAVVDRAGHEVQRHDRQRETEVMTGSLRLDWRPTSARRLDLLAVAAERRHGGDVSDLFVVDSGEGSEPGFDSDRDDLSIGVRYHDVVREAWFTSAFAGCSLATAEVQPWSLEPSRQDQTLDGRFSGVVGGGVFSGGAGFRPFSDRHELRRAGAAVESQRGRHLLKLALEWRAASARRRFEAAAPSLACLVVEGAGGAVAGEPSDSPGSASDCGAGLLVDLAGARLRLRDDEALLLLLDGSLSPGADLDEAALALVDRWRPLPNLGVELGVRAAWLELEGGGAGQARLSEGAAERLDLAAGLVWDPEGRGRSRVYARAARRHPLPVVDNDRGPLAVDAWQRVHLAGLSEGASVDTGSLRVVAVAEPPTLGVVAGARLPTQLELVAGAETEILGGLAVSVVARSLETQDEMVRIVDPATGNRWLAAGGDTLPFSDADGLPARVPELTRTTRAIEVHARKRLGDGWQAEFSVAWTDAEGTAAAARGPDLERLEGPLAVEPFRVSDLEGSLGPLPGERTWQGRALASYTLAAGTVVGFSAWWASGAPLERLGASATDLRLDQRTVEAAGAGGRTSATWEVDLRIAQPLTFSGGELELGLEVLNLFDRQATLRGDPRWSGLDEDEAAGLDAEAQRTEESWGTALVRQRPRRVELGLRFRW